MNGPKGKAESDAFPEVTIAPHFKEGTAMMTLQRVWRTTFYDCIRSVRNDLSKGMT